MSHRSFYLLTVAFLLLGLTPAWAALPAPASLPGSEAASTGSWNASHLGQASVAPAAGPDLSTSSKGASSTVRAGDPLTYTIVLRNTGSANATVDLTDPAPANTIYSAAPATASAGAITCSLAGDLITWQGAVDVGAPVTLTFGALVNPGTPAGTVITNTATVDDHVNPPAALQAFSTVSWEANFSGSRKTVDEAVAAPGDILTYAVTVANSGNRSGSVLITDSIPILTTFVPGSAANANYSIASKMVWWSGMVQPGAARTIAFQVCIVPGLSGGTLITNTAVIDDDTSETSLSAATTIAALPNLRSAVKTAAPAAASGDVLTYTVTMTNSGSVDATACLTDPLPGGVTYLGGLSASTGTPSYDAAGNRILWSQLLAPGASAWVQYAAQVTVPPTATAVITNTATVADGFHAPFARSAVTQVPLLWLDCPPVASYSGEMVDVGLMASNVPGLQSVEAHIRFVTTTLDLVDIAEGSWFTPTVWSSRSWDNAAGTIDLAAALNGRPAGKSGSGLVATLRFRARAGGSTPVSITGSILSSTAPLQTTPIPHNRADGVVTIIGRLVTGVAHLQGRSDDGGAQVQAGGALVATTAADGSYSFFTPSPAFTVTVSMPGYLWAERPVVASATTLIALPTVALLGGDVVGGNAIVTRGGSCSGAITETIPGPPDGAIDIQDLTFVLAKHDLSSSSPDWGPDPCYPRYGDGDVRNFELGYRADINGDGRVDVQDLAMVNTNFGKRAPCPWP